MFTTSKSNLLTLLKENRKKEITKDGKKMAKISNTCIPNISKGIPGGSYYINSKKYDNFLKEYSDELTKAQLKLSLTEKIGKIAPIVVDIDIQYKGKIENSPLTQSQILKCAKLHLSFISKYLDGGKNGENFQCVIMRRKEKPQYLIQKDISKDGIHLQFPFIKTDKFFKIMMRNALKTNIHKILSDSGNINDENNTYDEGVAKDSVFWCMYGSSKPDRKPYEIDRVIKLTPISAEDMMDETAQEKLVDKTKTFLSEYNTPLKLVNLLSVAINTEPTDFASPEIRNELRAEYSTQLAEQYVKSMERRSSMFNNAEENTNIEKYEINELRDLISCLNPDRAKDYDKWIYIGLLLYKISDELIFLWKEFSQKCPDKYDEELCEQKWGGFAGNDQLITLRKSSLRYLAKLDDQKKFDELRLHHIFDMVMSLSYRINNDDTAKVLHRMYKDRIICDIDTRNKARWFIYKNAIWKEESPKKHLYKYIGNQLVRECDKIIDYVTADSYENKEGKDRIMTNVNNMIHSLKTDAFKSRVIAVCESEFACEDKFLEKLDKNVDLIALGNGVYDLKNHEFRNGRPEDYLTLRASVDFDENAKSEELNTFLDQILPLPELKEYVLKLLAISITGIFLQQFTIFIGVGSNGKTTLLELMERLLGTDYFTNVHHTLVTKGRTNSSGPTPEIAKLKGKRLVYLEEPDNRDRINVGQLKWLTGGGKLVGRFLNENEIEFYPHYKMFFTVNNNPKIESNDHGTWRRIICVPFLSQFEDTFDASEKYHFKKDPYVALKFDGWKSAFFNILMDHLKLYQKEGLKVPSIVRQETDKYETASDFTFAFSKSNIVKTGNKNDYIVFPKLYSRFEKWFRANMGNKAPEPREVKQLFEASVFKTPITTVNKFEEGWKGFSLVKFDEETDDFECDEEFECDDEKSEENGEEENDAKISNDNDAKNNDNKSKEISNDNIKTKCANDSEIITDEMDDQLNDILNGDA